MTSCVPVLIKLNVKTFDYCDIEDDETTDKTTGAENEDP